MKDVKKDKATIPPLRTPWIVKHNQEEFSFETLDAAVWYATGVNSVSKSVKHINPRLRVITLVPFTDEETSARAA